MYHLRFCKLLPTQEAESVWSLFTSQTKNINSYRVNFSSFYLLILPELLLSIIKLLLKYNVMNTKHSKRIFFRAISDYSYNIVYVDIKMSDTRFVFTIVITRLWIHLQYVSGLLNSRRLIDINFHNFKQSIQIWFKLQNYINHCNITWIISK